LARLTNRLSGPFFYPGSQEDAVQSGPRPETSPKFSERALYEASLFKQHLIVVGDRTVDLARATLLDGRGNVVPLRPRAWLVLQCLATRAGRLVRKDEIMDEVWSDCEVTEDSLVQAIGDIRRALGTAGRAALRTLPRRGYMLAVDGEPTDGPVFNIGELPASCAVPHLSIVVLPFANLGGDAEQEYFVDGVTESLTTDLSRIAGSFVIARNTAFTFKGKAIDVQKLGRVAECPVCP